jgi:metal-sulfur cluster biosynthetic enzyme
MGAPISRAEIEGLLRQIDDPCSVNAGVPLNIVEMGLVPVIEVRPSPSTPTAADVHVELTVTEHTCLMFHAFARQAEALLQAHPGVGELTIRIQPYTMWTEDEMEASARERLAAARTARRAATPVVLSPSRPIAGAVT